MYNTRKPIGGQRLPKKPTKSQLGNAILNAQDSLSQKINNVYRELLTMDTEVQNNLKMALSDKKHNGAQLENGDLVVIGYLGTIDGVPFQGGTSPAYILNLGSGALIPGFEEQLVGKEVGSTFDITVKFPENYGNEATKGKEAVFRIAVISAFKTNPLLSYIETEAASRAKAAQTEEAIKGASGEVQ